MNRCGGEGTSGQAAGSHRHHRQHTSWEGKRKRVNICLPVEGQVSSLVPRSGGVGSPRHAPAAQPAT